MITAANIHYELGRRTHGLAPGGIGALLLVARRTGLIAAIDHHLHLLKRHLPYFESDHVLNIAFNLLAGGRRLEHLERLRNDEVYLDALGAVRIPDPTTEGDFCRRFREADVLDLMEAINTARLRVYAQQPADFFGEAIVDIDGTLVATDAECKEGVDIAYDGTWGYHPLVVTLANTAEPLFLVNRSGNRPSHEGAHAYIDRAIALCRRAGFRRIALRGDTDFSQTAHLDRWDAVEGVRFLFGMGANAALVARAEGLPADAYSFLERPPKYEIKTAPRQRPEHVKAEVVRRRGFETIHTLEEMVGRVRLSPDGLPGGPIAWWCSASGWGSTRGRCGCARSTATSSSSPTTAPPRPTSWCSRRMAAATRRTSSRSSRGACRALTAPVDDLVSNWAYMVMASLAWTLKAWAALLLPEEPRHAEEHRAERRSWLRMEFATFRAAVIELPCQVVRGGGRLIYRLLSWNPWQGALLRLVERLRGCWLC